MGLGLDELRVHRLQGLHALHPHLIPRRPPLRERCDLALQLGVQTLLPLVILGGGNLQPGAWLGLELGLGFRVRGMGWG